MSKTPKSKKSKFESDPDAWQRFERAVDVVLKAKPKHRAPSKQRRTSKSK